MSEMDLRQLGFMMFVDHLHKAKKEYKNLKNQNELEKACFWHYMVYGDFKDLTRRTASDKRLRDKAFNIAKNPKYDGFQMGLASMVHNLFW